MFTPAGCGVGAGFASLEGDGQTALDRRPEAKKSREARVAGPAARSTGTARTGPPKGADGSAVAVRSRNCHTGPTGCRTLVNVSIIVPAFNEEKLLGRTLERLQAAAQAFTALGWGFELIVCDNNSTDRTRRVAEAAGARVVFEPVNQIARARNRGASVASGDWFFFVDADSYPSPELLAEAAAWIASGRCVGGGATVVLDEPSLRLRFWSGLWNGISRLTRWPAGSFVFCEATAFRRLGGFSQELFVAEEIEFGRRLKRLARESGRQVVILWRHPLTTSARKARLYSQAELARFLLQSVIGRGRSFRDRAACWPWYDGRR